MYRGLCIGMTRHQTDTARDQDDVTNRRLWRLVGPIVVSALVVFGWAFVQLVRTGKPQDLVLLAILTALVALAQLQKIDIRVGATQINLSPVSAGVLRRSNNSRMSRPRRRPT